ncbi:kinase-like domain-containing protein [Aspergillus avenaceus]|uniref:Kinase-like domain-containing protein n=1 Tax=Aspergillus avenaceus TaxID=36643 RepID=A0A5N6THS5_ASPAV|nr:kinase-like domain-containing protein [Aspergillus avenaceus]
MYLTYIRLQNTAYTEVMDVTCKPWALAIKIPIKGEALSLDLLFNSYLIPFQYFTTFCARWISIIMDEELSDDSRPRESDKNPSPVLPFTLDLLSSWATTIRKRITVQKSPESENIAPVECTEVLSPMFGSFNIVIPLRYSDGTQWAVRIPQDVSSDNSDESAVQAFVSEALTMRLLKRETTIPVPSIHEYDASFDNALQHPFMLMDFIDGRLLPQVWFDSSIPKETLETRRLRTLDDLADAMVQLEKFTFSQCGSPVFDPQGHVSGIGSVRTLDIAATLAADSIDPNLTCDLGPFNDPRSYFLSVLNRRDSPPNNFGRGVYCLLRLFIEWLSTLDGYDSQRFVLCHPDLDSQNIFVNQEGNICGIIDWERVAVVPECLGNLSYPAFLARDWDPTAYAYDPEGTTDVNELDNSPEELMALRSAYQESITRALLQNKVLSGSSVSESPRWTRRSLAIRNLKIAADNLLSTHGIVEKVFGKIQDFLSKQQKSVDMKDRSLYDIACDLADGNMNDEVLSLLKEGFLGLCETGLG